MEPGCRLYHHESASRDRQVTYETRHAREIAYFCQRWRHVIRADPHFSPNLQVNTLAPMLG